jgi:RNA ligase
MRNVLEDYKERGLLHSQSHPRFPLTIWNYSEKVQYDGLWDDVTLMCRGLITDDVTGGILVKPFPKFFNYEEIVNKGQIPTQGDCVYVQEKADGSLGILFYYEGEWIMATRGSFTSDQAIKGLEMVQSKYKLDSWIKEYAYLVEIIYPENRIVVNYGEEKVIFLSAVPNNFYKQTNEEELHWSMACDVFKFNGVSDKDITQTKQHFNFSDQLYRSLKAQNDVNKEGFVLRFQPGNFRMKIKFEEYLRLHRIMTNVTSTSIWEVLSTGGDMSAILVDTPDEFYGKVTGYANELISQYQEVEKEYLAIFDTLKSIKDFKWRASFAEEAKKYKNPSLLFKMYDRKEYSSLIWKIIKPQFYKI